MKPGGQADLKRQKKLQFFYINCIYQYKKIIYHKLSHKTRGQQKYFGRFLWHISFLK